MTCCVTCVFPHFFSGTAITPAPTAPTTGAAPMRKEAGNRTASGVRGCSHATAEAVPTRAEGASAATTTGAAERPPRPGPSSAERTKGGACSAAGARRTWRRHGRAASARRPQRRARAPAKDDAQATAPSGEEEAHRAVRLLRRAVHDGVAPEAARAGAEAPQQGGLPRRGDERAVQGVRRAPLQRAQRRAAQRREGAPPATQTQQRSLKRTVAPFTSVAAHAYETCSICWNYIYDLKHYM